MVNFSQELTIAPWVRKTKILLKAGVEPVVSTYKDMSSVLMTVKMGQGTGRRRSNSKRREIYRRWEKNRVGEVMKRRKNRRKFAIDVSKINIPQKIPLKVLLGICNRLILQKNIKAFRWDSSSHLIHRGITDMTLPSTLRSATKSI